MGYFWLNTPVCEHVVCTVMIICIDSSDSSSTITDRDCLLLKVVGKREYGGLYPEKQ